MRNECATCGAENTVGAKFCVRCGAVVSSAATGSAEASGGTSARPYAEPFDAARYAPPVYVPPPALGVEPVAAGVGFRCPYCQSPQLPVMRQKISAAGWIVFIILLVTCLPLCIIGLFIKEDYRVCSSCGLTLG